MRRLMWFTWGLTLAAILCAYWLDGLWCLLPAGVSSAICLCLFPVKKKAFAAAAILFLGAAVGFVYCCGFDLLFLSGAKQMDAETAFVQMEAVDYTCLTDQGMQVDGNVTIGGKTYPTRLYYYDGPMAQPGDLVSGTVRFRYTPSGGLQSTTYHKGEGIFLLAYGEQVQVLRQEPNSVAAWASVLRRAVLDRIDLLFSSETAGFAKALVLGHTGELTFSDDIAFQKSGLRHVIAVSGLHISILFGMIYFVTGKKNLWTILLGLPSLVVFAAIAGFTPSIVRACVMQGLLLLALTFEKEYDPLSALAFAVGGMVLINPLSVTSVSLQLSVASNLGIILFSQPVRKYLLDIRRLGRFWRRARLYAVIKGAVSCLSVSVGAMLLTLPLCAWYFGMVSVMGILSNLLVLWLISYILCGILAACGLSVLWLPLGGLVACITQLPILLVQYGARILSGVPFAVAYTDSPYAILWLFCAYILLGVFLLSRQKRPVCLLAVLAALYGASLGASWLEPRLDSVRMTVLDVGQGQCVILQSRDRSYMIDCGGEDPKMTATAALRALGSAGITRLDGLILTHYDEDHCNGASYLLAVMPVDTLYLPNTEPDSRFRAELTGAGVPVKWVEQNMTLSCAEGELTLYPAKNNREGNESSTCILFQSKNCAILITGDSDVEAERSLIEQGLPVLDALVVGHHGAYTSTGLELLIHTQPKIALISAGRDNIHTHPDPRVLSRLERFGCLIRRTDLEGTILFRR